MGVCDVPVIQAVCNVAGDAAASLVTAPFDWLAQAMGAAASWLFQEVWTVFDSTTAVDVTQPGYVGVYDILFGVAVFVMLLFFCLQLITGLIHRDPTALTRAALGLAKSVLGSFVLLTLTGLLLEVTDELSVGIVQATGNTMSGMGGRIALIAGGLTAINLTAPGAGAILTIFLAGLAIAAACIVWFSLLIRKALLLVAIVFGPVALAGASWDATRGWLSKWASFVIALIVSKLVLVVIFLVAITQVAAPISTDLTSVSQPIAGVALMFIAAFAPYISYKFLHFAGFDMYHAMSAEQEAKQSLNRPVPIPSRPGSADATKKVLDGGSGSGSGATPSSAGGGGAASVPAVGSAGTASGASIGGAAAGAGSGAAAGAAAGPIGAAAVAGAAVVKSAATAGPRAGAAIGGAAEGHASAASEQSAPPPPSAPTQSAPAAPSASPPAQRTPPPSTPKE
ncbi:conjugal transfer protein TrbL [Rathayibacter soli]|uniref:conjugal transfer protein TrbL n=1 Tax=Rathayibacter soli TaxID=3144168 RepID=UPI0027E52A32|nr:conjugal transfer protein TrbL [Glaciibacter superstes]